MPRRFSRAATCLLAVDWTTPSSLAALEKLAVSTTRAKRRIVSSRSMGYLASPRTRDVAGAENEQGVSFAIRRRFDAGRRSTHECASSSRADCFHVPTVVQSGTMPRSDRDSNAVCLFAISHISLDKDAHTLASASKTALTICPLYDQECIGGEMQTCCGSTCQDYRNHCGDGTASCRGGCLLGPLRVGEDHLVVAGACRGGGGSGAKSSNEVVY